LLTKDGQRRRICWVGTPLRDAQGSVNYVVLKGIEVTELRRAQEALQHSEAALRESQERLRALTGRLLQVQEEEGRRIARELHDDLNQRLAELAVDAEDLSQRPPKSAKELSQALGSIGQRLGLLSDAVHRTAYQLHPSAIEHLGVGPALKQYCAEFTQREKIAVRFSQRRLPPTIPPDIGLCVYRVTQEALHNVAKHSAAKQAWVSLSGGGDGLRLQVWDRGQGFDPALPRNTGLGLIGVEERIRLVGGTLTIHARPQHGVRLEVHVPLLKPPNPPA
jgi:signal transduction histidine kinase